MERLASGSKDHYYGKADVTVYRLIRDGRVPAGRSAVFGANVKMLTWGGAFWPTYLKGDNTGLIATDSMKNFIQRETLNYTGADLEDCCRFPNVIVKLAIDHRRFCEQVYLYWLGLFRRKRDRRFSRI